jgi:hypothetical protein
MSYRSGTGETRTRTVEGNGEYAGDFEYSPVGALEYDNDATAEIQVPEYGQAEFNVTYSNSQEVEGLYLNSHRVLSGYQSVQSVPVRFSTSSELIQSFLSELFSRLRGYASPSNKSPMLLMKESLIAAAIYGEGNSSVSSDAEALLVWRGFQEVLESLFPSSLGFTRLRVDSPEVIVETEHGDFALEAISGGLSAIFELSWQIYLRSRDSDTFTVCFDEPENHLHPSLQRELLPSLMRAFPNVSFVVATHSPFVVTSSPEARVYVLRREELGGVTAEELDWRSQPVSAESTLRNVLGVESTLPIWLEDRFEEVLSGFTGREATPEMLRELKSALTATGLASSFPAAADVIFDLDRPADGSV